MTPHKKESTKSRVNWLCHGEAGLLLSNRTPVCSGSLAELFLCFTVCLLRNGLFCETLAALFISQWPLLKKRPLYIYIPNK